MGGVQSIHGEIINSYTISVVTPERNRPLGRQAQVEILLATEVLKYGLQSYGSAQKSAAGS